MKRLIIVPALAALLSGCAVGGDNARNDMVAASVVTAPKYKACPIYGIEFDRDPGGHIGPFGWKGQLSEDARAARTAREAADALLRPLVLYI